MLIWIIVIVLIGLSGLIGYGKGAIRTAISMIGLFLGALFAGPMAHLVKPMIKSPNPVWGWILPPVIIFAAFSLVFFILGFVVHHFVFQHFKNRVNEDHRLAFERLNQRWGIGLGAIEGAVCLVILGLAIYIVGYPSVQMSGGENDPGVVRFINKIREQMKPSGLDKTVATFDPMPETFYLKSDILGLIYNNSPGINRRLANYPAFISLAEKQEYKDLGANMAYQDMLKSQAGLVALLKSEQTQGIMNNPELMAELEAVDLKDLSAYLQSGKSEKYADQKIIGHWVVDMANSIKQARMEVPMLTNNTTLKQFKITATNFFPNITMVAAAENKLYIKVNNGRMMAAVMAAAAAAARQPGARGATPAVSPVAGGRGAAAAPPARGRGITATGLTGGITGGAAGGRGGRGGRGGAVAPDPTQVAPPVAPIAPPPPQPVARGPQPGADPANPAEAPKENITTQTGSWTGSGDTYELSGVSPGGHKDQARIENDRLFISDTEVPIDILNPTKGTAKFTLVMIRAD